MTEPKPAATALTATPSPKFLARLTGGAGGKDRLERLVLNLLAVLVAAIFAAGITSIILLIRGDSPRFVITQMWDYGTERNSMVSILNAASV